MASADHWFKFYYHRILVSCIGWTDEEFGAYVKLLIHQFDKGSIPSDEKELRSLITSYKKTWPKISQKFRASDPGRLVNDFMDELRQDRNDKAEKSRANGYKGGRPPKTQQDLKIKPSGYAKKRHIISDSVSNSDSINSGVGMGGEENEVPAGSGFWSDEIPKNEPISILDIASTIEFISLVCQQTITADEVLKQWEAFKIQQLSIHEWYQSQAHFVRHFRHSIKQQINISKNGNKHGKTGKNGFNQRPIVDESARTAGKF